MIDQTYGPDADEWELGRLDLGCARNCAGWAQLGHRRLNIALTRQAKRPALAGLFCGAPGKIRTLKFVCKFHQSGGMIGALQASRHPPRPPRRRPRSTSQSLAPGEEDQSVAARNGFARNCGCRKRGVGWILKRVDDRFSPDHSSGIAVPWPNRHGPHEPRCSSKEGSALTRASAGAPARAGHARLALAAGARRGSESAGRGRRVADRPRARPPTARAHVGAPGGGRVPRKHGPSSRRQAGAVAVARAGDNGVARAARRHRSGPLRPGRSPHRQRPPPRLGLG